MSYYNKLLQNILSKAKVNHKESILKLTTIKEAHVYCKTNYLSGQETGLLIENYIKNKFNMTKNKSNSCSGDLKYNNDNLEIKTSLGGKNNSKFNYVQIRMNHDCIYILMAYYLSECNIETNGELFIFRLTKDDIKTIILKYGGYAHGTIHKLGKITKKSLRENINAEYSIRPKYNSNCWKELMRFRIINI